MNNIINFNTNAKVKENEEQLLERLTTKEEAGKRVHEFYYNHTLPERGKTQREIRFLYEGLGYIYVGNRKLIFEEVVEDVKIGSMNPDHEMLKGKAHFAFRSNDEWYYVILPSSSFNYDKKELYSECGLNIIHVDVVPFCKNEYTKWALERGDYFRYMKYLYDYFKNNLMRGNTAVKLIREVDSWEW